MKIFNKERQLTPSWDLVRLSIDLLRKHFWEVYYLSFLPGLTLFIGVTLMGPDPAKTPATQLGLGTLVFMIGALWAIGVYPGFIRMTVKAVEGKEVSAKDSFRQGLPRLPALIAASLLSVLCILLGVVALIIPAFLLLRGLVLAPYYVVDQELGPIEAMKKSYRESVPVSAWIWGVIGVQLGFAMLARIFQEIPSIGFLISMAITYLVVFVPALRYTEVAKKAKLPAKV